MIEDHMDIFRNLHTVDWRMQGHIGHPFQRPTVIAGNSNDLAPLLFCVLHRVDHIPGIPAAGDRHDNVTNFQMSPQLEPEDLRKPDVIGHCHHRRYVIVQALKIKPLLRVLRHAFVEIVLIM